MKQALIFDPYLDTLGGGERYVLTLVKLLLEQGWRVEIIWKKKICLGEIKSRFGISLEGVIFIIGGRRGFGYDLYFHLSDGSIPVMLSRKNILHFQVPFRDVNGSGRWNRLKMKFIHCVICNSFFTKHFIDREYSVESEVVYPPVPVEDFRPAKKENLILAVGRFSQLMQSKRQDVLIEGFKRLIGGDKKIAGDHWRFVLAGATEVGGKEFFQRLVKEANGYPIELIENPPIEKIKDMYGRAKIFWNASGYGVDEEKNPKKTEHFGITVVEAMAAGDVPVVIGRGGIKEIVEENKSGYFWTNIDDLVKKTRYLIYHRNLMEKISRAVIKSSRKFAVEKFNEKFLRLIG